jgi:hypothetical protein
MTPLVNTASTPITKPVPAATTPNFVKGLAASDRPDF